MSQPMLTFAEAFRSVLDDLCRADPALIVVGEVPSAGPTPFLTVPVADRGAAGLALGLALGGRRVMLELADTSRLPAIVEVLAEAGAIAAAKEFSPTLVVRIPYGTEALDLAVGRWLADLPAVRTVCPSSPDMAAGLLRTSLSTPGVTLILDPRSLADVRGQVSPAAAPFSARLVRTGRHVTLAAWGPSLPVTEDAAATLASEGTEADVIDLVSLSPVDGVLLGQRVRATGRLVVVHPEDPGLARRIREIGLEEAFLYLEAPLAEVPARPEQVLAAARGAVTY